MDFRRPVEAVIPGARGQILGVLVETTDELNLRTIAGLADVSVAQASRVLPGLVELGLVERREAPPSALFRLVPDHVAVRWLSGLAGVRDAMLAEMGGLAEKLPVRPTSVIVFGSFARGEADAGSDIDAVFVRPAGLDEDDDDWSDSVESWRTAVRRVSGNPVEILEVADDVIGARLRRRSGVWGDIQREGVVVMGKSVAELGSSDG